jgi:predicted dehydrogenase
MPAERSEHWDREWERVTETIRVGIIGTGFGAAHVGFFRQVPGVEVTAICSAQQARVEQIAERLHVPFATADYRTLLAQDIDAVVVATPPALHRQMTLDAIAAGKHVFCEKPMAASLAEAREMLAAAEAAGIIHMMNHQLRFGVPYSRAAELAEGGYLGQLAIADATVEMNPIDYMRLPFWSTTKGDWFTRAATAGGLLASSAGPHIVDLMLWFGGPVTQVAARTIVSQPEVPLPDGSTARTDAEDGFIVLCQFASGALGTIRGVPIAHHGSGIGWSLALHGTGGSLQIVGETLRGAARGDDAPLPIELDVSALDNRILIASRFIGAIRAGGPSPAPNFADGVAAQALLDASLQAARSDRWVTVPQE